VSVESEKLGRGARLQGKGFPRSKIDLYFFFYKGYRGTLKEISLLSLSLSFAGGRGGERGFFQEKDWFVESGCLRVQPKTGGKFHLKLNIARDTDSSQVP